MLAALQAADGPMSVEEVAADVRLHVNTARFHLDALVADGLAERASEDRTRPGRPRMLYAARQDAPPSGDRSYRLLAQILTSYLAGEVARPDQAALHAGEAWGRYLAERPAPFQRVTAESATRQLVGVLDDIGFEPEATTAGRRREIRLHNCPFREAAEQSREVTCSVHLGLMRGLLAEVGAPLDALRLDPFVTPNLCVAHLGTPSSPDRAERRR